MPLNRRKKLLLVGGIVIVVMLMFVAYYTTKSSTPAAKPWGTSPAGSAPGTGGTTPTSYIPPSPSYQPIGDSTADGTPVDGTAPSVPVDPVQTSGSTGVSTGGSTDIPTTGGVVADTTLEPPVIIDCLTQKSAMDLYYALKSGTTLKPMPREYKQVSNTQCDAAYDLVEPGTTNVKSVDSRRFTFGSSGIVAMDGPVSGVSIIIPKMLNPITGVIEAPPSSLINDFTKYFNKVAGSMWNTVSTANGSGIFDIQYCYKNCYNDPNCVGINYKPSTRRCQIITNKNTPLMTADPEWDFYQRIPTTTVTSVYPSQITAGDTTNYMSNFTKTASKYFSTGNTTKINVNNEAECAAACQKDYTCSAFNHWPSLYRCDLQRDYTNQALTTHSAANFYKRITPGIPPVVATTSTAPTTRPPAYGDELTRFQYLPGQSITSAFFTTPNKRNGLWYGVSTSDNTPTDCAKACYKDLTCRGFNFNKSGVFGGSMCNLITTDVYPYARADTTTMNMDAYMIYDAYGYAPQIEPTPVSPAAPAPAPVTTVGGVSTNERCGPNWGGTKCPTGLCCSGSDWCGPAVGTTTAWCANGGRGRDGGIYDGV